MDPVLAFHAVTHVVYARLLWLTGLDRLEPEERHARRDRGAVSLEQVLWFAAAGVAVAVIATIVWSKVKKAANTKVNSPKAP